MAGKDHMKIDVAVVDDEKDVQVYLQDILEAGEQFNVTGCYGTGEEALAGIARLKPDVVLMDIRLPGTSGLVCTRALKALYPDLKVIMVTAMVDEQHVVASLSVGADGFLPKPFSMAECWKAIRETVEQGLTLADKGAWRVVGELRRMGTPGRLAQTPAPRQHLKP
jgi:DNA-binding NarL/FixJ family response regulator